MTHVTLPWTAGPRVIQAAAYGGSGGELPLFTVSWVAKSGYTSPEAQTSQWMVHCNTTPPPISSQFTDTTGPAPGGYLTVWNSVLGGQRR